MFRPIEGNYFGCERHSVFHSFSSSAATAGGGAPISVDLRELQYFCYRCHCDLLLDSHWPFIVLVHLIRERLTHADCSPRRRLFDRPPATFTAVERGENVLITKRGKPVARITRETQSDTAIDWAAIDKFRDGLRKSKTSVTALRKRARY